MVSSVRRTQGILRSKGKKCKMERVREKSENFKNTKFSTIPPGKAVQEMTYTVSAGMLNPTHSLTQKIRHFDIRQPEGKTYM